MKKFRRTKLLDRSVQQRDARLVVLATEGQETERQYFEGLQARGDVDRSRVQIQVIATPEDGDSAPEYVLERLTEFLDATQLLADDEIWLVIDVDRWGAKKLGQVTQACVDKNVGLAVSNPCFELWLIFHFTEQPQFNSCKDCERHLRQHFGGYNKANLRLQRYPKACVRQALERAARQSPGSSERWPSACGSHVYRIFESFQRAGVLSFKD